MVRRKLTNGRATKLFIVKELEDSTDYIHWLPRGVIVRLKSPSDQVQIVFSHFAHGEEWDSSLDDVTCWLQSPSWRSILAGDLNVERLQLGSIFTIYGSAYP